MSTPNDDGMSAEEALRLIMTEAEKIVEENGRYGGLMLAYWVAETARDALGRTDPTEESG